MNETLSLQDIFKLLKKNLLLIVIITAIVTSLMVGYIKVSTVSTYMASTKLFIGKDGENDTFYDSSDISLYQNLLTTYSEVIKTKELVKEAVSGSKYSKIDENKILSALTVNTIVDTQVIQLTYTATDSKSAAEILDLITDEFIKESKDLVGNSKVIIIEPVEVPKAPINNNNSMKIIVAFCLGLMISMIVVFFKEYLNDTYDDEEILEKDIKLPVLSVIPYTKLKEE